MLSEEVVLSGVLSVSLLVFFAKIFAGIVFGPYALGSLVVISGHKIIEISEVVLVFSQIGAVLILFTAGLEMTFAEFRAAGLKSFIVGGLGVVVPFFSGFYLTSSLGFPFPA